VAVVPYCQGGLEMAGIDDRAAVKGGIDSAEAEDLGFRTAGGGAVCVLAGAGGRSFPARVLIKRALSIQLCPQVRINPLEVVVR
jgi:hypothetical protein